jgi:MFS transporter, ACS family, glucarate transporter
MVAMLCATATASYMCRVNISTAGALLMKDYHLSQVEMGRIFSGFLLGYALFQVPAGILADRWGARRVLALACWLWVGATAVLAVIGWGPFQMSVSAIFIAIIITRLFLGIAESPTFPAAAQGVSRWVYPAFQGRVNGIVIASIGIGSAIAPPLISGIMIQWGWRIAMLVSAVPALVIAILWMSAGEPVHVNNGLDKKNNQVNDRGVVERSPLKKISFILLTISYTLQGYIGYIFVSWFYLYLVQERHFDLLSGAWMSSLPWILSIISIPLGGIISDRLAVGFAGPVWGRRIIPMFGLILSGILISIGAHTGSAVMAAISLAFATAFILCTESPFWTMMMNISGERSGMAGGIMNMGSNMGGIISPSLTPILANYIGWENALHIASGLAIIAALLWFWVHPGLKELRRTS